MTIFLFSSWIVISRRGRELWKTSTELLSASAPTQEKVGGGEGVYCFWAMVYRIRKCRVCVWSGRLKMETQSYFCSRLFVATKWEQSEGGITVRLKQELQKWKKVKIHLLLTWCSAAERSFHSCPYWSEADLATWRQSVQLADFHMVSKVSVEEAEVPTALDAADLAWVVVACVFGWVAKDWS